MRKVDTAKQSERINLFRVVAALILTFGVAGTAYGDVLKRLPDATAKTTAATSATTSATAAAKTAAKTAATATPVPAKTLPSATPAATAASATDTTPRSTPVVVLIHSRECPVCARVRPIFKELQETYEPRVHFVMLDVTDDKSKTEAKATAKSIHLGSFFNLYSETFPCVGIFDSSNHTVRELCGFNSKEKYESYIKKALAKTGA